MEKQEYRVEKVEVDSYEVYIGKDATSNDYVSLGLAKANDLWFHVKGTSSAHVIINCHDNNFPEKDTIKKVAALTAYHSKQKNAKKVPVIYTFAKYVKKARGAKAGSVIVSKEKMLMVKPEPISLPH